MQRLGALLHDREPEVLVASGGSGDADAVVLNPEHEHVVRSARKRHAYAARTRMLLDVDEGLTQNVHEVDLLVGRQLESEKRVRNRRRNARAVAELLDRLLDGAVETRAADLKPEGREHLVMPSESSLTVSSTFS